MKTGVSALPGSVLMQQWIAKLPPDSFGRLAQGWATGVSGLGIAAGDVQGTRPGRLKLRAEEIRTVTIKMKQKRRFETKKRRAADSCEIRAQENSGCMHRPAWPSDETRSAHLLFNTHCQRCEVPRHGMCRALTWWIQGGWAVLVDRRLMSSQKNASCYFGQLEQMEGGQPIILPLHSTELDECSSTVCLVTFCFRLRAFVNF
ncbi:hypothetical protein GGI43DRAFT_28624 [Trichoderma evansii]